MMGFDPLSIRYIRQAHERGLGCGDPREIEIVGDTDFAEESWGFHVGNNFASATGHALWHSPASVMQKLFFHTPLVNVFVFASFFYHDFVWWPLKGKAIQEKVRRDTSWGRLFESY